MERESTQKYIEETYDEKLNSIPGVEDTNNTLDFLNYPSDVFKYWWDESSLLPSPAVIPKVKDLEIVKSHFGENQYFHSMGFADGEASELQEKISGVTDKEMRKYQVALAKGDTKEAYYHLGVAMHYMTDSYTPGHTIRDDKTGEIQLFQDYTKMNKVDHVYYDDLYNHDRDGYDDAKNGNPFDSDKYYKLAKNVKIGVDEDMKVKSIPEICKYVFMEKLKKLLKC